MTITEIRERMRKEAAEAMQEASIEVNDCISDLSNDDICACTNPKAKKKKIEFIFIIYL